MLHAAAIPASPVHFLPLDFERDDLGAALTRIIDTARPVLFWWLGVTPYLSADAVAATLRTLGGLPSAAVVLDHASPLTDLTVVDRAAHEQRRERVSALGEPWISEYRPPDIAALARECGFDDARPVHERAVIDRAIGRPRTAPGGSSHLLLAARRWPRDVAAMDPDGGEASVQR